MRLIYYTMNIYKIKLWKREKRFLSLWIRPDGIENMEKLDMKKSSFKA